jgi:acetyl-CoA synthetase
MISSAPGIQPVALKPGSAGYPLPGVDAVVVDDEGKELPRGEKGVLTIRRPWPGMLMGIHNNPERYRSAYWERFPGLYYTGDYAIRDEDGYFWLLGRADEVLKVAGHRLGTLELENAAVSHPAVTEAAAAGIADPVKGEKIVLFAILADGHEPSEALKDELRAHVRQVMGAVATPEDVYLVSKLPKTRSGKIMRRVLAAVASGGAIGDVSTLEDEASVEEVRRAFEELKESV